MEVQNVGDAPVLAARTRMARDLRGLTQAEVVGKMQRRITPAALSQIENGRVRPAPETLTDLASALGVPEAFLMAQWPGASGHDPYPMPYFRHLRRTPARDRRRATALAVLLNDLVAAIELHVRLPELEVTATPVEVGATRDELDEIAEAVRDRWGLGHEPIKHVIRELERHGVPVARLTMGTTDVDAFSTRFSRRPVILLTLDKSNYVRSRFDAAHELGHLVMHVDVQAGARHIESQAQDFAAAFLLPRSVAETELPRKLDAPGWSRLAELKLSWGLSLSALLYRQRSLGIVSADGYQNAMRYLSAKGWRSVEPGDRELGPPEATLLLERALRTIELEAGLSVEEFVRSAGLPLSETLELVKAAIDPRPHIEL